MSDECGIEIDYTKNALYLCFVYLFFFLYLFFVYLSLFCVCLSYVQYITFNMKILSVFVTYNSQYICRFDTNWYSEFTQYP